MISSVVSKEDEKGRIVQKPQVVFRSFSALFACLLSLSSHPHPYTQLEIMLEKAEKLEETVVATACEKAATLKT